MNSKPDIPTTKYNMVGQNTTHIFTSQLKLKRMKVLNGIISVVLGLLSLYLMFIKAQTNQDIMIGFTVLLAAVVFMSFMIIEEQKEEIEDLRQVIRYPHHKNEVGYGDESPAEYKRMLKEVGKI